MPGLGTTRSLLTSLAVRRFGFVVVLLAIPLVAFAHDDHGGIDVVDVSGPLDALAFRFLANSIEDAAASGQELVVLQINSRAVLDGDEYDRLVELIGTPPVPVATWIGPAPAAAYGGASVIFHAAANRAIAPGSEIGPLNPVVLGEIREIVISPSEPISAEESGLELQPTLRQYLQDLDGRTFITTSGEVTVSTLESFAGGVTVKQVTFKKPGFVTRFFRLAVNPEAAFFFLVVGLSIATFEFFALGPGVAAGVASISLLLAGWGIVTLPVRWWAFGLAVLGWWALTAAYQKGGILVLTVIGTVALQIAGTLFIDGSGQIDPRWWLVLPSVLAALFFFLLAMPTVQRARLSTQTIGHESLIGRIGVALVVFDPNGIVEVNGAKWRATAHREAGIVEGSDITVTGVDGLFLEVDRSETDRET